jgi:hypothetical protein
MGGKQKKRDKKLREADCLAAEIMNRSGACLLINLLPGLKSCENVGDDKKRGNDKKTNDDGVLDSSSCLNFGTICS